ncbi:MAG: hypothetical protein M3151_04710, partial [Actinomycetota bacterium]|nr:hypothetical protein [Actinomycetota bacterium]
FILGQNNVATLITRLAGPEGVNGVMFEVQNNNADANDTALSLKVQPGEPPMKVNSSQTVANLTADNADKLGGKPAADHLRKCQNGTVFGRAEIDGEDAASTFSTTGVKGATDFICNAPSENVLVRRDFTGHYKVVFGDIDHSGKIGDLFSGPGPEPKPMVSSRENDKIVSVTGPLQCSTSPPPTVSCYIVEVRDFAGPLVDGDFTIAIL